jgi:hypothetical protein
MPHVPLNCNLMIAISIVRDMMLKAHYFQEAHWLGVLAESPEHCRDWHARARLSAAAIIAREFGFPEVAMWIDGSLGPEN